MITYKPFWKTLERKNETWYSLVSKYGVLPSTLSRMKHEKPVSSVTVDMLCNILNCNVEDIMQHIPDKK